MSSMIPPTPLIDEQPIVEKTEISTYPGETYVGLATYLLLGILFGLTLTKSEAVSWFRIQEMFRFQSFHMYGLIGCGFAVAAASLQILKRSRLRSFRGEPLQIPPKARTPGMRRYWMGGIVFGLGWALLGACPGPMFALLGTGLPIMLVPIVGALLGTRVYAWLRPHLPH
jgi:uncharacterized membrane protein YedE/YeeE